MLTLPVGVLLSWTAATPRRRWVRLLAYTAGWAMPALPVVLRSWTIDGFPMGPPRPPSVIPVTANAVNAVRALGGHYLAAHYESLQLVFLGTGLAAFLAWVVRGGREAVLGVHDLFFSRPRFVLSLWIAAYMGFLLGVAAQVNLPLFDLRLIAPASVFLMLLAAVAVAAATRIGARFLCGMLILVALLKTAERARAIADSPTASQRKQIRESARLRWVERETTPADLIVADDAHDIAFYFDRRVLSFDYFVHSTESYRISESGLCIVLSWMRCEQHDNVYIVLRNRVADDPRWTREPFLSDLVGGRLEPYSHVLPYRRGQEAFVFNWVCGPCGSAAPARGER